MLSMAQFCEAVSYALRCINREQFQLKAKQEEALRHLYQGKDVFAWIPTGYGKSICYQLLPFMYGYKRRCSSSSPRRSIAIILHSTASQNWAIDSVKRMKPELHGKYCKMLYWRLQFTLNRGNSERMCTKTLAVETRPNFPRFRSFALRKISVWGRGYW